MKARPTAKGKAKVMQISQNSRNDILFQQLCCAWWLCEISFVQRSNDATFRDLEDQTDKLLLWTILLFFYFYYILLFFGGLLFLDVSKQANLNLTYTLSISGDLKDVPFLV